MPLRQWIATLTAVFVFAAGAHAQLTSRVANRLLSGTALPATCTVGDIFFDTDATAGSNVYGCTASDTWTLQGTGTGAAASFSSVTINADGYLTITGGAGATTTDLAKFVFDNTASPPRLIYGDGVAARTVAILDDFATEVVPLLEFQAGISQAAVAGGTCSTPASNAPSPTSVVGSNTIFATYAFDKTTDESIQCRLWLPDDWTGAIDWDVYWRGATGSTNSVVWAIQTICVADAETGDPAFNTASTITDAGKGTTNQFNLASATGITITGCAANEIMFLKFSRDADNGSDTYDDDAQLISFRLKMRRTV